jgi:uncharacterized protein YajQ (UPF0234 family)
MAQDHSFDVVSNVNLQELRNAVQQAQKEIGTRFDFRGTSAELTFEEAETPPLIKLIADHAAQLNNVHEILSGKMAKRAVPWNVWDWAPTEQIPSGNMKQQATLQQGLSSEKARAVVKTIKDLGLKVQARIEGETVRVSGKQLDELQTVIQTLKAKDFGVPIQAENYR